MVVCFPYVMHTFSCHILVPVVIYISHEIFFGLKKVNRNENKEINEHIFNRSTSLRRYITLVIDMEGKLSLAKIMQHHTRQHC